MNPDQIKERIYSVDFLRGVVMMIMLLDHTRDFVHHDAFMSDPTDPMTTTPAVFFTRWITHFCAPTFVFLSGVSIYLQKMNGKSNRELSWFLFTRGLWLIVLEFTVVRFLVTFNLDYGSMLGMPQVIWVIGVSMIVMAALIYLPLRLVGALGLLMIIFHNLLDRYDLPPNIRFGGTADVLQSAWLLLHQQSLIPIGGSSVFIVYPLIPWIGVMAAGYAVGVVYSWNAEQRRKWLLAAGIAATLLFVGLRASNFYGDPNQWVNQTQFMDGVRSRAAAGELDPSLNVPDTTQLAEPEFTIVSFLNTAKYPPSLLFLLMTLGPALIVLALTDSISGQPLWQWVAIVFGRVPLFFYLLQWVSAHLFGIGLTWIAGKDLSYFFQPPGPQMQLPPDNGFSLPVVYFAWIAGLVIIFPLCLWYGNYKRRSKHWLLSYL